MAVSVFGSIPTVAFFIAFQRHFIESAVASGIK
jgi:ABC-type glycerol-3-phosphate transport system permease component